MLSGDSTPIWNHVQTASIIISFAVHVAATNELLMEAHRRELNILEDVTSGFFLLDYLARLWTCQERRRFARFTPLQARLRFAASWEALVMAASCVPVLSEVSEYSSWLTLPRILLLFRASRWRAAVSTAKRVVFVNRDILYTSLALVSLTILASATLLNASCAPDETCAKENGIHDLPSATYVATMMLTGQASPEGGQHVLSFRAVTLLTAFLSVPFFAVPAAMLTWGFEGEAQRLAQREAHRLARRESYTADAIRELESSESSEDEEYEDYIKGLGGEGEDEEAKEAAGVKALAFFEAMAAKSGVDAFASADAASKGDSTSTSKDCSVLFEAHSLARTLRRGTQAAARTRQRRRDALELLTSLAEEFDEGLASDQAVALERRLRAFARAISDQPEAEKNEAVLVNSTGGGGAELEARVEAMQNELTALRRTTVSGLAELKAAIGELAKQLPATK